VARAIKKILESGVVAGNTCGKFRAEPKPGELIFFVRPGELVGADEILADQLLVNELIANFRTRIDLSG
jgi:hypothetical protein